MFISHMYAFWVHVLSAKPVSVNSPHVSAITVELPPILSGFDPAQL